MIAYNKYLILLIIITNSFNGFSQRNCGVDEYFQYQCKLDKNYKKNQETIEKLTQKFINENRLKNGHLRNIEENLINIPVVVHVLWNQVIEKISIAQIQSQIDVLNKDYQLLNSDTVNTPIPFKPLRANCQVSFCLANFDPNGDPTSGIIYKETWKTSFTDILNDSKISFFGGDEGWDSDSYLNIWIVPMLLDALENEILGSATPPGGISYFDGVVIGYKYFGTIGTAEFPYNLGRTTTHEIGHWLNLKHIWGNTPFPTCLDTDYVEDTPNQEISNVGCNTFPHFSCADQPYGDMFMNYMDYSDDNCMNLFTHGQNERIQAIFQPGGDRYSILTSQKCCSLSELTIINASIEPPSILAGDNLTLNFAVDNNGYTEAAPNYVSFHLSQDAVLTPGQNGDIYLGEYYIDQPIAGLSQTILLSTDITIPGSVSSGIYYVFFSADGAQTVAECNELNNYATAILSVTQTPISNESGVRIWFDNNFSSAIYENVGNYNNYEINGNVSTISLSGGLHTINVQFKDTDDKWSSIVSSFFYKAVNGYPAGLPKYQYWFDIYSNRISSYIANTENLVLNTNINADYISEGLHTFNIRFKPDGKHWSSITSSFVYKPKEIPTGDAKYEYWIDNDHSQAVGNNITPTDHFILISNINTDNISDGLHRFNIRFRPDGKTWSSITSSFFYKPKVIETGIAEYEYWIDNDYSNAVVVSITPTESFILLDQLDMLTIEKGLHVLHSRFRPDGKEWSSVTSSFFYKNDVIAENNISKCVYWFDSNWANYYTINLGNANNVDAIIYANVDGLNEGEHTVSMFFNDDIGLWSSVVRDTFMKGENIINSCPDNQIFVSGLWAQTNTGYQWQLNDGSGFADISDNSYYSGTNTDTLILTDPPESWYGYQYRCIVSTNQGPLTSSIITLRFVYFWNGSVSSEWENPLNWDCQGLPGENADVIINTGTVIVNSNPVVSSITIGSVVNFSVNQQKTITLTGH